MNAKNPLHLWFYKANNDDYRGNQKKKTDDEK